MAASTICFRFEWHEDCLADSLALERAGSNSAARMAITAITTSNSTSVNAANRQPASTRPILGFPLVSRVLMLRRTDGATTKAHRRRAGLWGGGRRPHLTLPILAGGQ